MMPATRLLKIAYTPKPMAPKNTASAVRLMATTLSAMMIAPNNKPIHAAWPISVCADGVSDCARRTLPCMNANNTLEN